MWAVWWAWSAYSPVGCQVLPCVDAAGCCCVVGSGHEVAGCGILGGPGASAASLVGGVRVLKTPGCCPHPPAGEARSWG